MSDYFSESLPRGDLPKQATPLPSRYTISHIFLRKPMDISGQLCCAESYVYEKTTCYGNAVLER
jgi:hypothetical protein